MTQGCQVAFFKCLSAEWQLPNSPTCLAPMKHREHPQKHKPHLWSWKSSPLGNRHKQGKLEVSLLTQPQVLAGRWAASAQVAPGFTLLWLPAPNGASKQSNKPQHLPWQFSSQCLGTLWTRNRPGEGRHWPDLPHSSSQKGAAPKRTNQCFGNPSPLGDTSAHIQQIENLCVVLPARAQPFTPTVIQTTRAEARWWMK